MLTIRPFFKIWNNSLSLIKPKPKLQHMLNFANIADGEMMRLKKWLLPLNINITIFKAKLLRSLHELI